MAILLRGRKYHYRFRQDGKNYSGACLGCEVPPDASPKIIASIEKKALEYDAAGIPRHAVRGVVGHVSDDTTDLYSHDLQTARLIQHLPPAKLEKPD